MSIIYNNTEIENITYNGNSIDTVNYNNTEVFSGTKTLTVNKDSNIKNIIINNTTYTSNTTLNIKPGTSVTLNCTPNGNSTSSTYVTTTYSFSNWTGYTTSTSQSFTFIMPNENITYIANGTYSTSDIIPESTLLTLLNTKVFNSSLLGRQVQLSTTYPYGYGEYWTIIRVNYDSYDLWCSNYIDYARSGFPISQENNTSYKKTKDWAAEYTLSQNGTTVFDPNTHQSIHVNIPTSRVVCLKFELTLSSEIQSHLKTGLNVTWPNDKVVMLSAKQLNLTTSSNIKTDKNVVIPYFNDHSNHRDIDYLTTTYTYYSYDYSLHIGYYYSANRALNFSSESSRSYHIIAALRVG